MLVCFGIWVLLSGYFGLRFSGLVGLFGLLLFWFVCLLVFVYLRFSCGLAVVVAFCELLRCVCCFSVVLWFALTL